LSDRRFVGSEIDKKYYEIAEGRIVAALNDELQYRSPDLEIYEPPPTTPLTTIPKEWHTRSRNEKISMPSR
jgi:hypothetical protein